MAKGKTQGKGGKGAKKYGRKKRKLAFQRYKVTGRYMAKLERHVLYHPNDKVAAGALRKREEHGPSWVRWREYRKTHRRKTWSAEASTQT